MLNYFKEKLNQSEFLKNVITLITGTVIAQAIPFLIAPILSRLYTPDDFSVFGLFISIVGILSPIASARYDLAIMLPKEDHIAKRILLFSIKIAFIFSIIILIISIFFNHYITEVLKNAKISIWLYLIPFSVFIVATNSSFSYWYNRKKKYKSLSFNKMIRNGTASLCNLGLGIIKWRPSGLIIGQFAGDLFATSIFSYNYYKLNKPSNNTIQKSSNVKIAKEYKDFPLYSLPAAFLDNLSSQFPILLISNLFISSLTGYYFFSIRILSIPAAFIGAAVAQTFYQKFTEYVNENRSDAIKLLFRVWKNLLLVSLLPSIIIFFFGGTIFQFIFGINWLESGRIASILMPYILFSFISSPTSTAYIVLRLQHISLFFGIFCLIYRLASIYIGYYFNDFYLGLKILVLFEIINIILFNIIIVIKLKKQ